MTHSSIHCAGFRLDIWGGGTSVALTQDSTERSVHWQGDEAAEIMDRVEAGVYGPEFFKALWADYEEIAQ